MKAKLLANSSSGEPYGVEFAVNGKCVQVFCNCKAGVVRMMCKHKLAFITGDTKMLFDQKQASLLAEIRAWPQFSKLQERLSRYEKELDEIEAAKAAITSREKATKARLGSDLATGAYSA